MRTAGDWRLIGNPFLTGQGKEGFQFRETELVKVEDREIEDN